MRIPPISNLTEPPKTMKTQALIPVEQARRQLRVGKSVFYEDRVKWMGLESGAPLSVYNYNFLATLRLFLNAGRGPYFSRDNFMDRVQRRQVWAEFQKLELLPLLQKHGLDEFVQQLDKQGYRP